MQLVRNGIIITISLVIMNIKTDKLVVIIKRLTVRDFSFAMEVRHSNRRVTSIVDMDDDPIDELLDALLALPFTSEERLGDSVVPVDNPG